MFWLRVGVRDDIGVRNEKGRRGCGLGLCPCVVLRTHEETLPTAVSYCT